MEELAAAPPELWAAALHAWVQVKDMLSSDAPGGGGGGGDSDDGGLGGPFGGGGLAGGFWMDTAGAGADDVQRAADLAAGPFTRPPLQLMVYPYPLAASPTSSVS